MKKTVTVEIEDLRDLVGGSDVAVAERGSHEAQPDETPLRPSSTVMCYKFAASPHTGATWTKIKANE